MNIAVPLRIEAFDNSHTYGADPVSAMVSFVDGKPNRKDYRKYKTKTAAMHDDYDAMREVVRRRYIRVLKEGLPLPDLIVIDGGKGHMEVAREIIEDELGLSIPIAGLAKDDKHQTSQLLYGNPVEVIPLKRTVKHFISCNEFKMKCIDLPLHSIANVEERIQLHRLLMEFQGSVQNERRNY